MSIGVIINVPTKTSDMQYCEIGNPVYIFHKKFMFFHEIKKLIRFEWADTKIIDHSHE